VEESMKVGDLVKIITKVTRDGEVFGNLGIIIDTSIRNHIGGDYAIYHVRVDDKVYKKTYSQLEMINES
jgi:hypothetical protein